MTLWHLLSLQVLCRQSSTLMIMKLTLTQTGVCLVIILFAALMVRSSTVTICVRVLIDKCRLQNDRPTNRLYKYYGIVPKKIKDFSAFLKINIVCNYSNAWTDFRVIPLVTKWWRINQTTDFRITEKSKIDKASHEYKSRVTSVQKFCEITNIPRSAVSDNLKGLREENSKIRCPGSGRKKICDVNDRWAEHIAAAHRQWSAQRIWSESARKDHL